MIKDHLIGYQMIVYEQPSRFSHFYRFQISAAQHYPNHVQQQEEFPPMPNFHNAVPVTPQD